MLCVAPIARLLCKCLILSTYTRCFSFPLYFTVAFLFPELPPLVTPNLHLSPGSMTISPSTLHPLSHNPLYLSLSSSYLCFLPATGEELFPVLELLLSSSLALIRSLPLEGGLVRSLADTLVSLSKCSMARDKVVQDLGSKRLI